MVKQKQIVLEDGFYYRIHCSTHGNGNGIATGNYDEIICVRCAAKATYYSTVILNEEIINDE